MPLLLPLLTLHLYSISHTTLVTTVLHCNTKIHPTCAISDNSRVLYSYIMVDRSSDDDDEHYNTSLIVITMMMIIIIMKMVIIMMLSPLSYFSFQPVLHDWCNKGRGMCYPVCGMVHIKEPLLLIGKSSLFGDSEFPFSL